ncbi:sorting nexin-25-like [Lytechinus pictus]|uniref:sorting nexin-25-like n=1 Tax=Lytechinus pictus TaxID=7653 RepID=UPI0030B9F47C
MAMRMEKAAEDPRKIIQECMEAWQRKMGHCVFKSKIEKSHLRFNYLFFAPSLICCNHIPTGPASWLLQEVELLFTEAQWGYYLSLLRDLLWPGGVFNPKERETKTPDEINQTKADALHELTHNPAAAVLSVLLGEDHLREGISLILDSLQDQALNKHLLFTILDHAMDQLVPEIHDAKFQDLLAAMP